MSQEQVGLVEAQALRLPSNVSGWAFLLIVLGAGVLLGSTAAHHPWMTVAIGLGGMLLTGCLVVVSRLGVTLALIWGYFFLSIVDPSKSPVTVGAIELRELPFFWLFLPAIFGLLSLLLILGAGRVLWTSWHEPRLTMMSGICIMLLLLLTLYGLVNATLRGRSPVLALGNTTYLLGYLLFFPFTMVIRDWLSWRRLAHGFLVAIGALCIEIAVLFWLLFAGWGDVPRIFMRGSIFFQVGAIISLSVISARGEGITKRRRLCFWTLGIASLAGLVLSNTRGFYIGFYVAVFVLLYLMRAHERIRFLKASMVVLIGVFLLGMALTNIQVSRYLVGHWDTAHFYYSLSVRQEQLPLLLSRFRQAPISGMGLGAAAIEAEEDFIATSSTQLASRNELSAIIESFIKGVRRPNVYELDHIVLLMQFGVVGFLGWLSVWGLIVLQGVKVARLMPYSYHRALLRGAVAGFVGCLVSGATNPYLSSVLSTSFIGLLLALINSAALFILRNQEA
jgi:hypothetical protein